MRSKGLEGVLNLQLQCIGDEQSLRVIPRYKRTNGFHQGATSVSFHLIATHEEWWQFWRKWGIDVA